MTPQTQPAPKRARIFIWNTYWGQIPSEPHRFAYTGEVRGAHRATPIAAGTSAHHPVPGQNLTECTPTGWCLKMEGRITDLGVRRSPSASRRGAADPAGPTQRGGTRFTDMFSRVVVRLDPELYPDTPLIEVRRARRNRGLPRLTPPPSTVAARLSDPFCRRPRVCGPRRPPVRRHRRVSRRFQPAPVHASRPPSKPPPPRSREPRRRVRGRHRILIRASPLAAAALLLAPPMTSGALPSPRARAL